MAMTCFYFHNADVTETYSSEACNVELRCVHIDDVLTTPVSDLTEQKVKEIVPVCVK